MNDDSVAREQRINDAFVTLADTLVNDFDVIALFSDLALRCVDLLQMAASGVMVVDPRGRLRVIASSSEQSRMLELMELQNAEGPCLDCHRTGEQVLADDLVAARERWPQFAEYALGLGFRAAYALPMKLRSEAVGAVNLFHDQPGTLSAENRRLGQALADIATIALLQQQALRRSVELAVQLQEALNSRVAIEQAKGVLAERLQIDMPAAFEMLRTRSRQTSTKLSDLARAVVRGEVDITGEPPTPT